jgi:hypothetical protein
MFQADEIAGTSDAEGRPRDEPFEVLDALQRFAELSAVGRPERKLLDGVEPVADGLERDERPEQPGTQQAAASGSHRPIEFVEE